MKISKELAKGSTALLVLSVISKRDMYGYQITEELSLRSQNVFQMKSGTLYPLLHTLEQKGLVLRQHADGVDPRVDAVGERKIDDAVFSAEGYRGFCKASGKRVKTASLTTCEQHSHALFFLEHLYKTSMHFINALII